MTSHETDIEETLHAYWRTFESLQFAKLTTFWDRADPSPLLFPEEEPAPICDWQAIDAYFANMANFMRLNETHISEFAHKPLADKLASATFRVRWYASLTGFARPMAGFTHHSATLRNTPSGWKICQYMEMPRSAVLYFRGVRMDIVPAEFVARAKAAEEGQLTQ